jgi:hypothetical protein
MLRPRPVAARAGPCTPPEEKEWTPAFQYHQMDLGALCHRYKVVIGDGLCRYAQHLLLLQHLFHPLVPVHRLMHGQESFVKTLCVFGDESRSLRMPPILVRACFAHASLRRICSECMGICNCCPNMLHILQVPFGTSTLVWLSRLPRTL